MDSDIAAGRYLKTRPAVRDAILADEPLIAAVFPLNQIVRPTTITALSDLGSGSAALTALQGRKRGMTSLIPTGRQSSRP